MRAYEFINSLVEATQYSDPKQYRSNLAYKIAGAESDYRNIANQTGSSATGLFQITRPTYNALVRQAGKDDILANTRYEDMIKNPALQHAAMQRLEQSYSSTLARNKIEPSDSAMYALHRFGEPKGAEMMKHPDRAIGSYLDPEVFKVNPDLRPDMRGSDVMSMLSKKMSDKNAADTTSSGMTSNKPSDVKVAASAGPETSPPQTPQQKSKKSKDDERTGGINLDTLSSGLRDIDAGMAALRAFRG